MSSNNGDADKSLKPYVPVSHGMQLHSPFSMIVSGQSQSGKTSFVAKLLEQWERICGSTPSTICWLYGQKEPELFNSLKSLENRSFIFIEGFNPNLLKSFVEKKKIV